MTTYLGPGLIPLSFNVHTLVIWTSDPIIFAEGMVPPVVLFLNLGTGLKFQHCLLNPFKSNSQSRMYSLPNLPRAFL